MQLGLGQLPYRMTHRNPYQLIRSERVVPLLPHHPHYEVLDSSICDALDRSTRRLMNRTICDFIHRSIGTVGNVRILFTGRNPHSLALTPANAGATDLVVIPYRYKEQLEIALVTGISTTTVQTPVLDVAIVSGSSSLKIRKFRQLKNSIAYALRPYVYARTTRAHFRCVERCFGVHGSCQNDIDTLFTACAFISRVLAAPSQTVDHTFVRSIEPSWFEISRFRGFLVGRNNPSQCFVYDIKSQNVIKLKKPVRNTTRNRARWSVFEMEMPLNRNNGNNRNNGTHHSLNNNLACTIQSYHTRVPKQLIC